MGSTDAGTLVGTAAYMSPEQARGQSVDQRSDIWAFGVVLYEMLSGRELFAGPTNSDTLAAVLTKEPDLATIPEQVVPIVGRCLRKDPRQRWRSIGGLAFLPEDSAQAATAVPVRRSAAPKIVAAALGLVVVMAALATWLLQKDRR